MSAKAGEKKITIEELAEEVRKLHMLCQEPELGLFTWSVFFAEQCEKVRKMLSALGY